MNQRPQELHLGDAQAAGLGRERTQRGSELLNLAIRARDPLREHPDLERLVRRAGGGDCRGPLLQPTAETAPLVLGPQHARVAVGQDALDVVDRR